MTEEVRQKIAESPVKVVKLSDVKSAPVNPREITPESRAALDKSLLRFGLVQPIIINERTGRIVGGHQRVDLLRERGYEYVQATMVDLSEEEEEALRLTLNNPHSQGYFTPNVHDSLEALREDLPDLFDELRLFSLTGIRGSVPKKEAEEEEEEGEEEAQFDLSPDPYESYNYVVLIFRNDIDWTAAIEHFGLQQVRDSFTGKRKEPRIGLGRVVEGSEYLKRAMRERAK